MKNNFFSTLKNFVLRFFGNVFTLMLGKAEAAVIIVQKIKNAVEDPAADVVAMFIPGKVDDFVLAFVRKYLDPVLYALGIIYGYTQDGDESNLLNKFIEFARTKTKSQLVDVWSRFAAELIVAYSDKKISLSEGYTLTQLAYEAIFRKKVRLVS